MKRNITALAFIFMVVIVSAQSPQKMSYQAVIRDASNNLVRDAEVGMEISILQGSSSGTAVYAETHISTTSSGGVVSLEIGTGTVVTGAFSSIDWSNGPYFLQTETDPSGGTAYSITVTSQLLSVPYALYAANSNYTETDPNFSQSVAYNIVASDTIEWNNKSDFDGDYNSLTNVPAWSDSLDAHVSNISVPSTFYDSDFKIINSSGIAGNPITAPNTFLAGFGAGNVNNGTHDYIVTFVTSAGETGAGPASGSVTVIDNSSNGQILLTNLPVSSDGSVTARNIYRRFDGSGTYYYLTTINDNSTASYIDNVANASLAGSLPGSNSTERSIQFLASGLSGNRIYTLPDVSGKLVIDEGSVSVKTMADKSLKNDGRGIIQQLINNGYSKSADEKEWFDAYTDSDGTGNGVDVNSTDALFVNDRYVPYSNNSLNPSVLHDPSGWTDSSFGIDGDGSTFATVSSSATNFTFYLGGTFNDQFVYYASIKANLYYNCQYPSTYSLKLQSFDGVNWSDEYIVKEGTGNTVQAIETTIAINKNIQGLRLQWSAVGSGNAAAPDEQRLYYLNFYTDLGESQIVHTIPSSTFSSNMATSFLTSLVPTWENGASIQYKLVNDTEDSGWLNYNEVSDFNAFASEPNKLIIKLIPRLDSPTLGVPSISGFYITEL